MLEVSRQYEEKVTIYIYIPHVHPEKDSIATYLLTHFRAYIKVRQVYEELERSEENGEKLTLIIIRLSQVPSCYPAPNSHSCNTLNAHRRAR